VSGARGKARGEDAFLLFEDELCAAVGAGVGRKSSQTSGKRLSGRSAGVESLGRCSLSPVSGLPGTGRDTKGGYTLTDRPIRLTDGTGGGCWRVESIWDAPPPGRASNVRRRFHSNPTQLNNRADRGKTIPWSFGTCQQESTRYRVLGTNRPNHKGLPGSISIAGRPVDAGLEGSTDGSGWWPERYLVTRRWRGSSTIGVASSRLLSMAWRWSRPRGGPLRARFSRSAADAHSWSSTSPCSGRRSVGS